MARKTREKAHVPGSHTLCEYENYYNTDYKLKANGG